MNLPASLRTSSFSTRTLATDQQVLAWRRRVGHAVDVPPTRAQLSDGFGASIELFAAGDSIFTDVRTDAMVLERPVARVSTDARRDFAFHLYLEGETGEVTGMSKKRSAPGSVQGIVAFDLNQPFRVERPACRVLTLFVPRPVVEAGLPDSESLHGRIIPFDTPLAQVALEHAVATRQRVPTLGAQKADEAFRLAAQLLLAAFRQDSSLTGAGRAALQAAVLERVRRFVDANLHQAELTPSLVVDALQLKRATIYRWFEHEGGLGAYIRHRRLREAADELVRFPQLKVTEIAYGLGFKSASDFTRAFRRAFDISPQDMRVRALEMQRTALTEWSTVGGPGGYGAVTGARQPFGEQVKRAER
ncbi:AraC family transcriptional regulator [Paraburkholderia sp. DHOC27]|uniref:helix-turn-helix transcriptional regulator n=1 Tax=Paraburkholderia sp. DHOC27 TaxID=2303330 RepID=UPI00216B06C5|nr:AraC family transcriptional regulator [Paraburkholderia sp. DHOC27]